MKNSEKFGMKLIELAQALEDKKCIEIQSLMQDFWAEPSSDQAAVIAWINNPDSVRIKPELKPIDLSVLIDSGIDCEFSNPAPYIGRTIGVLKTINPIQVGDRIYLGNVSGSGGLNDYARCKPRMNHWHAWPGGECPLPEGFLVEILMRDGTGRGIQEHPNNLYWSHDNGKPDIIAFKVIGTADTHCMPWEVES